MSTGTTAGRWSALDRLHRRVEIRVERVLHRELGVSAREFHALTVLRDGVRDAGGPLHFDELADEIGLSQSATSRLVTRLRDRGLITTRTSAHDRRSVDVCLTAVACDVLRLGAPLLERAVHDVVEALGEGDADGTLIRYLQGRG
ncbi:MarR family winged helix-turn-helix transcriptional regulator [Streptomyces sp. NPDC005722]